MGGITGHSPPDGADVTILLFDMAAIILLIGAGMGKSDSLLLTISIKLMVNKLATLIRIQSQ